MYSTVLKTELNQTMHLRHGILIRYVHYKHSVVLYIMTLTSPQIHNDCVIVMSGLLLRIIDLDLISLGQQLDAGHNLDLLVRSKCMNKEINTTGQHLMIV